MGGMAILPTPRAVFELSRYAVGQAVESAAAVATVPVRVFQVLGQVELLVNRLSLAAERAESLIDRVDTVVGEAEAAVQRTRTVVDGAAIAVDGAAAVINGARLVSDKADDVVAKASVTAAEAGELLDGYGPTLREAAPLARRFVSELTPEEVTAAIRMIDELPRLRDHLHNDVMPLLGTLDKVGPDLHSLLDVTRDLHLAVAGIPGLKLLRRRGEDKLTEEDSDR
jgi:hypothetical protein